MKSIIIFLFIAVTSPVSAQFAVGSMSLTYTDVARNRDLPFELLYPSANTGSNVPCADGVFPYIVLAHGFSMQATDYTYLAEDLAANGYMVLQLSTETGFAPSHEDYGLDILFLATHFREENTNDGSLFFGHVLPKAGVIGHSMGGGSAWLAAAQANGNIDCVVGMAPAETSPSAIDVAPQVVMPAMILSGSADAVTPPAQNHVPIFDGTSSTCKVFVNVLEGSHCGFADGGTLCNFGELGFNGLAASEQQNIALDLVNAWMDWHLKDIATALDMIAGYDETQGNTEIQNTCIISSVKENELSPILLFPNPCNDKLSVKGISDWNQFILFNSEGRRIEICTFRRVLNAFEFDVSFLKPGIYSVVSNGAMARFVVQ